MDRPSNLNAFHVKRQAYRISREDSTLGDRWNPFRHVWSGRKGPRRSQTWDGNLDPEEAQRNEESFGGGIRVTPHPSYALSHSRSEDVQGTAVGDHQEADLSAGRPTNASGDIDIIVESPETVVIGDSTNGNDETVLRKRRASPRYSTSVHECQKDTSKSEKKLEHRLFKNVQPREPFTIRNQLCRTLLGSWVNLLLVAVPAGITLNAVKGPTWETFVVNFIAVFPLYAITDIAVIEIEMRMGRVMSDFFAISTSNLFQLVSAILLLVHGQISVLKYSLIGGILANILLLLGLCILLGGLRRQQQYFNDDSAHTSSVMLSLASTSILIPTACQLLSQTASQNLVLQSRGAAVVLILVYVLYLFCTLHTHYDVFAQESQKVPKRMGIEPGAIKKGIAIPAVIMALPGKAGEDPQNNNSRKLQSMLNPSPEVYGGYDDDEEEEENPQLAFPVAIITFFVCAVPLYFCTDNIANSISALTQPSGLSPTFVGLILLPIPNCDISPITLAGKDLMDAAMDGTVVKSIQTALFVFPLTILLSWWLPGKEDVTLVLDGFEVVSLFATILLLNFIMGRGKSIWVMGVLLLADWVLIAIAAFFVEHAN